MERSWKVALPAPPPLPVGMCAEFVTPQEYDSTSTSSLCLSSRDSPLMSPIFAKMSAATEHLNASSSDWRPDGARTQPKRVETAIFLESTVHLGGPKLCRLTRSPALSQ